ncbi:cytochrome c oxidase subunit 3 family protein [Gimesia chilikensis]|uniref:cytochrome c oxidase subunit 3 n=1 Tax=Gimesia chilikensis TaxID=2605989 RepID=UPI0011F0008B|nr:cytochrome c oxidase subunit 3 [Gimesia chilikensis]KAA0131549.1 cytochrome c oxidase subunit 3 family protein [Gimesia chilikensis]
MNKNATLVAMQFDNSEQEHSAALLGMWIFLATEVLFFGGLFVAYTVYRYEYPAAFQAGSKHLAIWSGAVMTGFLLLGSLLVAISEEVFEQDHYRQVFWNLLITAGLGVLFLSLEFYEYHDLIGHNLFPGDEFEWPAKQAAPLSGRSTEIFFVLFFCMTGLHALHMLIGISLVIGLAIWFHNTKAPAQLKNQLTVIGLYWHFVDIIWVFLFPLFYLV